MAFIVRLLLLRGLGEGKLMLDKVLLALRVVSIKGQTANHFGRTLTGRWVWGLTLIAIPILVWVALDNSLGAVVLSSAFIGAALFGIYPVSLDDRLRLWCQKRGLEKDVPSHHKGK